MMVTIAPEVVERMEKFIRLLAKQTLNPEAIEIVALLPEPIDPDLLRAREIVADYMTNEGNYSMQYVISTRAGENDDDRAVTCALAGIRAGRELERSGK